MNKKVLFILSFIFFLGLGATWVINKANSSYDIPIIKSVPEFSFKNQHGKIFTEKELRNKITILDFIFTN